MKKADIRILIDTLCVKYAELNPVPQTSREQEEAFKFIADQLPYELETDKLKPTTETKTTIVDGKEVITKTYSMKPVLAYFDRYSASTIDLIASKLDRAYVEKPLPQIKFNDRQDLKKFLVAMKYLFPNVVDVEQTTQSFMKWRMSFDDKFS